MGIGLLSCPYAMRLSGWAGLLALAVSTCLFCLSGKLIVAGFKKIPTDMPQTYPALGNAWLSYRYWASAMLCSARLLRGS